MKKIIYILFLVSVLFSCSSDSSGGNDPIVEPPIDTSELPVAVNDIASTLEDEEIILSDLLTNDTVVNKARITSIDDTSSNNGSITDNRDGTYTYEPYKGYVGEDTFEYTLCDSNDKCSSATVTISVLDEGAPTATEDLVYAVENTPVIINSLLDNDSVIDDALITAIDDSNTEGSIVLNNNGTITYTPNASFVGNDTFVYSLCDDDIPEAECALAIVTITVLEPIAFNIPSEIEAYYTDMAFSTNAELSFSMLRDYITTKHTTILSYGQRHNYLYNADADIANTDNVILMYSSESRYWKEYTSGTNAYSPQTFNTEHIFPQSRLSSEVAVTDLHHLRSCDAIVNEDRSNFPYANGNGNYGLVTDSSWYPGDDWRGDVARMIMYLNVRYGEEFIKVGTLDLFLEWNIADPVSTFEEQRNNIIEGAQGNRNPFIDNPYLATLIWGGNAAENKWE